MSRKKKVYKTPPPLPFLRGWQTRHQLTFPAGNIVNANWNYVNPTNIKSGFLLPKYEEIIASLSDATNPYTRKIGPILQGKPMPVNWVWTNYRILRRPTRKEVFWTSVVGYPHLFNLSTVSAVSANLLSFPDVDTTAKLAFLAKVREAQAEFSAPTFFGELKETVGMIRHPLRGFTKATHRYRRKVNRLRNNLRRTQRYLTSHKRMAARLRRELYVEHANRFQSSLEQAYLQWTYGVSPLINDVKAMLDLLAKQLEGPQVKRLSVTIPAGQNVYAYTDTPTYLGMAQWVSTTAEFAEYTSQIRGALKIRLNEPMGLERLRETTGFNLENIVPTVYELLPYSFLVDYFSTMGQVVNGVFTNTQDLVYASHTRKMSGLRTQVCIPIPGTPRPVSFPLGLAVGAVRGISLNRVKADLSVNLRDLQFTAPDVGQLINTAVLAVQGVRRLQGDS